MTCHDNDKGSPSQAHLELAQQGRDWLEAVGEAFIEERFVTNCPEPSAFFDVARLERFTRAEFPRILLDPQKINDCPSQEVVLRDVELLQELIKNQWSEFRKLYKLLDDPEAFREQANEVGLSEQAFTEKGGGPLWFVVIAAAALVLTGCPSPRRAGPRGCKSQHTQTGLFCQRSLGHGGGHSNNTAAGYRWR